MIKALSSIHWTHLECAGLKHYEKQLNCAFSHECSGLIYVFSFGTGAWNEWRLASLLSCREMDVKGVVKSTAA